MVTAPGSVAAILESPEPEGEESFWLPVWFWCIPAMLGTLLHGLAGGTSSDEWQQLSALLGSRGDVDPQAAEWLSQLQALVERSESGSGLLASALASGAFSLLLFWGIASVTHLVLWLVGGAGRGWSASIRAQALATAPLALAPLIPGCGGLIGMTWATVLQIWFLSRAQGCSTGRTTAAVVLMHLTVCCCLAVPAMAIASALSILGMGH